ncbi:MAG: S9 family peptidase [Ignavibacteria bacterium]|nr:S9 family peptidase [Ignavibacteria bacterium]
MKKISILLFLSVFALFLNGFSQDKEITLESILLKPEFSGAAGSDYKSMNDGIHYSVLEDDMSVNVCDYETGKITKTLLKGKDFVEASGNEKIKISNYEFSADESKILISTDIERIYRRSIISNYYVWNTENNTLTFITKRGKVQLAELSPDGSSVAYVMDNNLFVFDLNSETDIQITKDGERNKIINGATDWVYEEELGISEGFEWSPDSKKIAYMRFDESNVKEYNLTFYGDLYPNESKYKYPKAGESNSIVTVHVYDFKDKKSVKVDVGNNPDVYIARIKWTPVQNTLSVIRLNRLQNKEDILFADAVTGVSKTGFTEENKYYIRESYDLTFLKDGRFLHLSDKNGYAHIYLHDKNGKVISQVTKGNFEVAGLYGIDEDETTVYYSAFESSQYNRDVFSVKLDGTGRKRISMKDGFNAASFSKTYKYYILNNSDANTPSTRTMYNKEGAEIKIISDNKKLKTKLQEYNLTKKEFFAFKTSDGVELNGWMMKPVNLDISKKYPVLMYVYGGPGSQSVVNGWGGNDYMWYQMLCQKGYVIACVDGRGTGARGSEFEKQVYGKMGKYELNDQIEAVKYLSALNFVDKDRIGIWGWSFGGYMSSLCITAGADYFKFAIAVAPVTSFRYYDNIYTERYLGLPKDNPEGYDDYAPLKYADKLKGKFLIVHGSADDNVHYQNTMDFVNELVKANKQFEMQVYPNKNHNIAGGNTRYHLYKRMTEFILNNL